MFLKIEFRKRKKKKRNIVHWTEQLRIGLTDDNLFNASPKSHENWQQGPKENFTHGIILKWLSVYVKTIKGGKYERARRLSRQEFATILQYLYIFHLFIT